MKQIFKKFLVLTVLLSMISQSFLGNISIGASQANGVTLNGNITSKSEGVLNSKTSLMGTGDTKVVTYQLKPNYSAASASGVKAVLFLPSYEEVDGKFTQVDKFAAPGSMGIKARILIGSNGDEDSWYIDQEIAEGGYIEIEYVGALRAGDNPSFQVEYTTYGAALPEGLKHNITGFVNYEKYNDLDNSSWETENKNDPTATISLITSNLIWDASLKVPEGEDSDLEIWDRYQYVDYQYEVENQSSNIDANIDGFHVSLNIDSQSDQKNGILDYDVNAWKYNPNGEPIKNDDPSDTFGQFVGVPGKGGILIYDITHYDGENLGDPIPYTHSGGGYINFDQSKGENRKQIVPGATDGVSKRKYLISIPLARQGFPDLPVNFKVSAITNVVFSEDTNWSKTTILERQSLTPTYDMDYNLTVEKSTVVFGANTYFEVNNIGNKSNVPVWNSAMKYKVDDGFVLDKIELILPLGLEFSDYIKDELNIDHEDYVKIESEYRVENDKQYLTFSLHSLNRLKNWDRSLGLTLKDKINKKEVLPLTIRVYGQATKITDINFYSDIVFFEKVASNTDVSEETVYTEVKHEKNKEIAVSVTEIKPIFSIGINSDTASKLTSGYYTGDVNYGEEVTLNYLFGIDKAVAPNTEFTSVLNRVNDIGLKEVEIKISEEYFEIAENAKLLVRLSDETEEEIDLSNHTDGDYIYTSDKDILSFTLTSTNFRYTDNRNLVSVTALVNKGKLSNHKNTNSFRIYQDAPHAFNRNINANANLNIVLPRPTVHHKINSNSTSSIGNAVFGDNVYIDFMVALNNVKAYNSEITANINSKANNALSNAKLEIKKELNDLTDVKEIEVKYLDGTIEVLDFDSKMVDENQIFELGNDVQSIVIKTGAMQFNGAVNYLTITGDVKDQKIASYRFSSIVKVFDDNTEDSTITSSASGTLNIKLPSANLGLMTNNQSNSTTGTVFFNNRAYIEYLIGTDNIKSDSSHFKTTLNINGSIAFHDLNFIIKKEMFDHTDDLIVSVKYLNGDVETYEYSKATEANTVIKLGDNVSEISVDTSNFISDGLKPLLRVEARVNRNRVTYQDFTANFAVIEEAPKANETKSVSGRLYITLPAVLNPEIGVVTNYAGGTTEGTSTHAYESSFNMDFKLNTRNVYSPNSKYIVELLKPSGKGNIEITEITLTDYLVSNVKNAHLVLNYQDGSTEVIHITDHSNTIKNVDGILDSLKSIELVSEDLKFASLENIMNIKMFSKNAMGSSQVVKATFTGDQREPYVAASDTKTVTKSNQVNTYAGSTVATIKGVNQVAEELGAGSKYTTARPLYRGTNLGYDYTLDQGYKSLGGFTASLNRVNYYYNNNNQTITLNTDLPSDTFDLYYLKIRNDIKPFIKDIKVYRTEDNTEVLWQELSAKDWVNNTSEGNFWRINTANSNNSYDELFSSHSSKDVDSHPYYKAPWSDDVKPNNPVSRVEVTLEFTRRNENQLPQLGGLTSDIIEYMGRFYETSTIKDGTKIAVHNAYGVDHDFAVAAVSNTVNTIVGHPFADSRTGANDNTTLSRKELIMGTVGEYKSSLLNIANRGAGAHGPDAYVPVATEYNEWLGRAVESFHDKLVYEFKLPNNPNDNAEYNFIPQYFNIEKTSTISYLDTIEVHLENKEIITIDIPEGFDNSIKIKFVSGEVGNYELKENGEILFAIGSEDEIIYPKTMRANLKHIPGYGDKTAEIDGVSPDSLGLNLYELDFVAGGIVNGDQNLIGVSNLYRQSDGLEEARITGSQAILVGKTPILSGNFEMTFDKMSIFDYKADGITPNENTVNIGFNNIGQADIKQVDFNFTPDSRFRANELKIPAEIFDGDDWYADAIIVDNVDVKNLFVKSDDMYILNLTDLFDKGLLKKENLEFEDYTLVKKHVKNIKVNFLPKDDSTFLYGDFTKEELEDDSLPSRLMDGSNLIIKGTWVDEEADGSSWNSTPTFVSSTSNPAENSVTAYGSFDIRGKVYSRLEIYKSAGIGNQGETPYLVRNGGNAPGLRNRISNSKLVANHLNEDHTLSTGNLVFFDEKSNKQINSINIAAGDRTKVLYRYENTGNQATGDLTVGNIPVFNPEFVFQVNKGLKINSVTPINHANMSENLEESINDDQFVEVLAGDYILSDDSLNLNINKMLDFGESVYVLVEYEAINNINTGNDFELQNKTTSWLTFARHAEKHNFISLNPVSQSGNYTGGMATNYPLNGKQYARVYNSTYRFTNPNVLNIESKFEEENITGKEATITVKNIQNTIDHNDTQLELYVTLDNLANDSKTSIGGGFHLSEFPIPEYPEGFIGSYDKPVVYFKSDQKWVEAKDFNIKDHSMAEINELKVDYGIVSDRFDDKLWKADDLVIKGIMNWENTGSFSTKHYDMHSTASIEYTRFNGQNITDMYKYTTVTPTYLRVFKAIATVDLNVQSFDTLDEALSPYNQSLVGKLSYEANEDIFYKISLVNRQSNQGINTNTPYGKAALIDPVIIDKIPEYLLTDIYNYYDAATNSINIDKAIADGVIHINWYDIDGKLKDSFEKPTVTAEYSTGLDVGGAQSLDNTGVKNNGLGLLSNEAPSNTSVNKAKTIQFFNIKYAFPEELGRGERIEIAYKTTARNEDLPYATDQNGNPIFAPFNDWYGLNDNVQKPVNGMTMDMASLLHDVGVTGTRTNEVSSNEFLMNSSTYLPGSEITRNRRVSNTDQVIPTFYDLSANKERKTRFYLRETANNNVYLSTSSGAIAQYFDYLHKARVNDNKVKSENRIMWSQDGVQLSRSWLYGASEFIPNRIKNLTGVDNLSNFYEHDGSLNHQYGSSYSYDNYTYAVQLNEEFTTRLHGVNMGDKDIESGLEYLEILPNGISPFAADGSLLGIKAYQGLASNKKVIQIDEDLVEIEIVQTPQDDQGYRAPKVSMEAQTYRENNVYQDEIPYVIRIKVKNTVGSWFNNTSENANDEKYQYVDVRVRVAEEKVQDRTIIKNTDLSVWHDHLTVTTIEEEPYIAIYDKNYAPVSNATNLGLEVNNYSSSYSSYEPQGLYIRGLNARATQVELDGKPALVGGDQLAMRKPTLRVWSKPEKVSEKDSRYTNGIDDFNINLYDKLVIHGNVENQQLETFPEYNRTNSGYNTVNVSNRNDDIWVNAPQTIGGARGTWFEPTITFKLPHGIVPVMKDGQIARYYNDVEIYQDVEFSGTINNVKHNYSNVSKDVSEMFNVKVEQVTEAGEEKYVMYFTLKDEFKDQVFVNYFQSLVISPTVKVIDNPSKTGIYESIEIHANSNRPVFNPIISEQYQTGSLASMSARDNGSVLASVGSKRITAHDRERRDSITTWSSNIGSMLITERLVSATTKTNNDLMLNADKFNATKHYGAQGSTNLKLMKPSIKNTTKIFKNLGDSMLDHETLDTAASFWNSTKVENTVIANANKHIEALSTGNIEHSRFLFTYYINNHLEVMDEFRIKVANKTYTVEEFEELGYSLEKLEVADDRVNANSYRVQFVITTPNGELKTKDSFEFLFRTILVDGFDESKLTADKTWKDPNFKIESYVSVISDDYDVANDKLAEEDFIIQDPKWANYTTRITDVSKGHDVNIDGNMESIYAFNQTTYEILQPKGEIRKNQIKPREEFTNGQVGDSYFNSSETIDYMMSYAKNTGSGVKKLVVEDILPTYKSKDTSISTSERELTVRLAYLTTGVWELPKSTLDRLAKDNKEVDDVFRIFMYVSTDDAIDGYESIDDWILVNPGGSSIYTDERFNMNELDLPLNGNPKKVRWVFESLDTDNYLVPNGARLDIDANPSTPQKEEVIQTDPKNESKKVYPNSVVDNAAKIGIRALSDSNMTLYIYNNAQLWGNYVSDLHTKYDQSSTRSFLTPSRPIVNVFYASKYFTRDGTDQRTYGWSDSQVINYNVSRHLKFTGKFVNADESMWDEDESVVYAEDTLIDPNVTFMLPQAVLIKPEEFTHVENSTIDETHPLSDDYKQSGPLSDNTKNMWTWFVLDPEGNRVDSHELKVDKAYTGPWKDSPQNTINIAFNGTLDPGYSVEVQFLGEVNEYNPSTKDSDFRSKALVMNNTGLLKPLNSRQNTSNILGYQLDDYDFNDNAVRNDRVVFSERSLFQYATFDNFGKRITSYSDLNSAGTKDPYATPTSEGSTFKYEVKIENPSAESKFYPPIYNVLPHVGDTEILKDGPRNSNFSGWLKPETVEVLLVGANGRKLKDNEYDVWVGPFVRVEDKFDMTMLPSLDEVSSHDFYYDLLNSEYRDQYFVNLKELEEIPFFLQFVTAIAVTYKDPKFELPAKHNIVLNYEMDAPINAPVLFENVDTDLSEIHEYANWNTFTTMQRLEGHGPQESNRAGVYITQQPDKVSIGNYIWNDLDYDGQMNEGNYIVDDNGRYLNYDQIDLDGDGWADDPGINDVKITLKTDIGNFVDSLGNAIYETGGQWFVFDEKTNNFILDEFGNKVKSNGPVVTYSKYDIFGYNGYYVLSNITPGEYRLEYEFPEDYNHFALTSKLNAANVKLSPYEVGEELPYKGLSAENFTVVSDKFRISLDDSDEYAMAFDLGAASTAKVGGNLFLENKDALDGEKQSHEKAINGYNLYMKHLDGSQAYSTNGKVLHTKSDKFGNYEFTGVPLNNEYQIEIRNENDEISKLVIISPFNHNIDPRIETGYNDGIKDNSDKFLSNPFVTDIRPTDNVYYETDQLVIDNIDFGFFERDEFGVIGNRVWMDLNRNGVQDPDEPGVEGVELKLIQYEKDSKGDWIETINDPMYTTSSEDGYYYFDKLPVYNFKKLATLSLDTINPIDDDSKDNIFGYRLEISKLPKGYTVTTSKADGDDYFDSDFNSEMITDFSDLITLEDSIDVGLAVNNLDIDLGIVKHGKGSISGKSWIDNNADGMFDKDEPLVDYKFELEVEVGDKWMPVYIDKDKDMVAPNTADIENNEDFEKYTIVGREYEFENLLLVDIDDEEEYSYRVVVREIPLRFKITESGFNESTLEELEEGELNDGPEEFDNKFKEVEREAKIIAISDEIQLLTDDVELPNGTDKLFLDHNIEEINLGLIPLVSYREMSGLIYDDFNKNGKVDKDEQGIEDIDVNLHKLAEDGQTWELVKDDHDQIYKVTSDENGNYRFVVPVANFENDEIEKYIITIDRHENYEITSKEIFTNLIEENVIIPDADEDHTVVTSEMTLVNEDKNTRAQYETSFNKNNVNAGFAVYDNVRSITATIFDDIDLDGIQDRDENGISDIKVNLLKLDLVEKEWIKIDEVTTDENGEYLFEVEAAELDRKSDHYLEENQYRVHVEYAYNMLLSPIMENENTADFAEHLDPDNLNFVTDKIVLVEVDPVSRRVDLNTLKDEVDQNVGLRVYPTEVKISGNAFENAKKSFFKSQVGLAGVEVHLEKFHSESQEWLPARDVNGLATVITELDGSYEFNVAPTNFDSKADDFMEEYSYRVKIVKLENSDFSEENSMIEFYDEDDVAYSFEFDIYEPFTQSVSILNNDLENTEDEDNSDITDEDQDNSDNTDQDLEIEDEDQDKTDEEPEIEIEDEDHETMEIFLFAESLASIQPVEGLNIFLDIHEIEEPEDKEVESDDDITDEDKLEQDKEVQPVEKPGKDGTIQSGLANKSVQYTTVLLASSGVLFALNTRLRRRRNRKTGESK